MRQAIALMMVALLALPVSGETGQVLPDELTIKLGEVANVGTNVTVVLTKRSIRSDNYVIGTWGAEGFKKLEPFPVSTYRGHVQGDPAMRVNANIEPGGVFNANFSDGRTIVATVWDRKIEVPHGESTPLMSAGNRVVPLKQTRVTPTPGGYLVPPQPMRRIQFAVEITRNYVDEVGGDVERAVSQVEQRFNDGDFVYARDLGVAWEVAGVVVRQDAEGGVDWNGLRDLDAGRYFNLVVYFLGNTGRPRTWGGGVFRSADSRMSLAPLTVARVNVRASSGLAHEVGHKFRACHNMDEIDAMRGAHSVLGSANVQLMLQYCEGRSETGFPAVVYSSPLPPFAMDDFANTRQDTPVVVDVLDNDYDGNGGTVSLYGVTPKSEKGGGVVLSEDKQMVVYTPPPGFVGIDRFTYTAINSFGIPNRQGNVKVDVRGDGLAAYLPLDRMEDDKHPAEGPYASAGQAFGLQTSFHKGIRGNALFNASSGGRGWVGFPNIGDPGRGSLSVSLWVMYPGSNSLHQSGVIVCKGAFRGGGVGTGALRGWAIGHRDRGNGFLFVGNSVRSRPEESFYVASDEPIRPMTWYHLALVMDRETKVMRAWVNNREILNAESRPVIPDDVIEAYAPLILFNGFDWKAGRACSAMVDEVRIYTSTLTQEQIAELYAEGKGAEVPDLKTGAEN